MSILTSSDKIEVGRKFIMYRQPWDLYFPSDANRKEFKRYLQGRCFPLFGSVKAVRADKILVLHVQYMINVAWTIHLNREVILFDGFDWLTD